MGGGGFGGRGGGGGCWGGGVPTWVGSKTPLAEMHMIDFPLVLERIGLTAGFFLFMFARLLKQLVVTYFCLGLPKTATSKGGGTGLFEHS